MHDAVLAMERGDFAGALKICGKHESDLLFVELAARAEFRAGHRAEAMALYRKLAERAKDAYSSIQAYAAVADWLVQSGRVEEALGVCEECVHAHPGSGHALPMYRRGLEMVEVLKSGERGLALWRGLTEHFGGRAIGRFAAGELWLREQEHGQGARDAGPCPLPRLAAHRVGQAPVIDGKPSDSAWQGAGLVRLGQDGGPDVCVVRVCYDDSALFVLAEVLGGAEEIPGAAPAEGEAGRTGEASFELMLSPWRDGRRGVRMNFEGPGRPGTVLAGTEFRLMGLAAEGGEGKVGIGWLVEMRIPFAALGRGCPAKGEVWAVNFVRRSSEPAFPFRTVKVLSAWAPMEGEELAPECAGYLIFR